MARNPASVPGPRTPSQTQQGVVGASGAVLEAPETQQHEYCDLDAALEHVPALRGLSGAL